MSNFLNKIDTSHQKRLLHLTDVVSNVVKIALLDAEIQINFLLNTALRILKNVILYTMYSIKKDALEVIETILIDTEVSMNVRLNVVFKLLELHN